MSKKQKITRSAGIGVDGYIVGGGYSGLTEELDAAVEKAAKLLRDHFKTDVTIRFNSDRMSGGAWVIDSKEDGIGSNSSIGLGARLFNSKVSKMTPKEVIALSLPELHELLDNPDSICFESAIDLNTTVNTVAPDSKYILTTSEFRDFGSLEEAAEYLFSHVTGLKDLEVEKEPLDKVIEAAESSCRSAAPSLENKVQER